MRLIRLIRLLSDSVGPLLTRARWKSAILSNQCLMVRPRRWISGGMAFLKAVPLQLAQHLVGPPGFEVL